MALEKLRLRLDPVQGACLLQPLLLLLLLLFAGLAEAKPYTNQELLTWLQRSNFGYQVLQQSLNSTQDQLCAVQVAELVKAADLQHLPALKVFDAWGKFPHGLLYGHFSDLGNYESCLSTSPHGASQTKYCLAQIQFDPVATSELLLVITLSIGTCIPAACSADQLNLWLNNYLQLLFEENVSQMQMVHESNCALAQKQPMAPLDWFAVVLLSCLALVALLCTLLDYVKVSHKLLTAFSLRQNLEQLLKTTKPNLPHIIPCLHGIRCLTIIWIIWGHDYMFLLLAPTVNQYEVVAWAQTPFSMLLQTGTASVDTFFLLGGTLLVMATLRELERQSGRLNVPLMYLHRIVRLTPVLAIAVLFFMTLFPRLDSGPLWEQYTGASQLCQDTWWATLLYVQNYAAAGRMCLGHSWYLAVDMQLFLLSPLLLWPLWRWRRRAMAGIVFLIVLLFACLFSIIVLNELTVFSRQGNLGGDSTEMRMIYYTTHARAMPWLMGLLFGYFLHREQGRKRSLSRWMVQLLWLLSFALIAAVLWSLYPYTQAGAGSISPLAGAFYICCSRIAWPLALCMLIWLCQNGHGGVINELLSWTIWQPISKLSYCMYIWHLLVEMVNSARIKSSQHFSNYDVVLRFWSDFDITLGVSLLIYLCVEAPIVRVETYLLRSIRTTPAPAVPAVTPTVSMAVLAVPSSVSQQNLVDA